MASGCNFLTLRPGVVIGYQRNSATMEAMADAGFTLVPSQDIVAFDDWEESRRRVAILLPGSELVRGGGGPRCMTLPVRRGPA